MYPIKFLKEDRGVTSVEYVVLVAGAGIFLAVGVAVLYNGLSALFTAWAGYFGGG